MALDKEKLLNDYKAGKTIRDLAKERGVSSSYIGAVLKRMPGYIPRHRHHDVETADLVKLRKDGKTYREIAKEVGMNVAAVYKRIKNAEAEIGK